MPAVRPVVRYRGYFYVLILCFPNEFLKGMIFQMRMTKRALSIVLAAMLIISMLVVGTVSASAATKSGLQAAFNAGGTVVLDSDCTYSGKLQVPAGKTVVLDLNGYELKSTNSYAIYNYGTLTINDSDGAGKVTAQEACVAAWGPGAVTTINAGTYTAYDNGVFMCNGSAQYAGCTWYINGGTFNANIQSTGYIAMGIYAPNDDTWYVNGGTFNVTNGTAIVQRAGTVVVGDGVVINVTGNGDAGKAGDSQVVVPTGYGVVYDSKSGYPGQDATDTVTVEGGTFNTTQGAAEFINQTGDTNNHIVVEGGSFNQAPAAEFVDPSAVATVNGRTFVGVTVITDAAGFVAACGESGSYVLGNDIQLTSVPTVAAGKDVTIDLAGYDITTTSWGIVNIVGELTINDSVGTGEISAKWPINPQTGSTTTINGGTINAIEGAVALDAGVHDATINVNGGTINSANNAVFMGQGTTGTINNTWNINAGTFNAAMTDAGRAEGYTACGIYAPNDDVWNVKGGTFNVDRGTGIVQRAGVVNVSGNAVFNVTGDGTEGRVGDSNVVVPTGVGVVYDSRSGYPGQDADDVLNVTGGTFTTEVATADFVNAASDTAQRIDISGGTFDKPVASEYCDEAFVPTRNTDGTFGVKAGTSVAKIGDTTYKTLQDAVNAAQDGDTIVLTADCDSAAKSYVNIPAGKDVTIDFAGYTYTSIWGFENHGTVTLKDSTGNGGAVAENAIMDNFGTFTVESGTYTSNYAGVFVEPDSVNTIDGGSISALYWGVCSIADTNNATVTVNNGTVAARDGYAFSGNGSHGNYSNTWNINGGTFYAATQTDGEVAAGIYAPNNDTWNINGGTFNVTDGVGIAQRAGTVNVADGVVFNVTGDGTLGTVGDSRIVVPAGTALVYDSKANYPGQVQNPASAVMNVTGGTFNAENAAAAGTEEGTHIAVSGGSFDKPVADNACAPGYVPAPKNDVTGMYSVMPDPLDNLAEINGYQVKIDGSIESSADDGNDIGTKGIRVIVDASQTNLTSEDYTDYGFVVAKVSGKTQADAKFNNLNKGDDRVKTISCVDTVNQNLIGADNNSNITLAVNGMTAGDQVAVRFYAVKDGKTYYAKYVKTIQYNGILATME